MYGDFYFPVVRVPQLSEICEAATQLVKSVRHHLCKPELKGLPPSCTGQGYFEIFEAADRLELALNPRRLGWDDNNRVCLVVAQWPAPVESSLCDVRRHFDNVLQTLGWHNAMPSADFKLLQYQTLPMHGTIDWPATPVDENDLTAINTAVGRVREALGSFPQCVYRVDPLWAHLERAIGCLIDHPRIVLFEKEPTYEKGLNVGKVNWAAEEYLGAGRRVFDVQEQTEGQATVHRSLLVFHPADEVNSIEWTIWSRHGLHDGANGTEFGAKVHRTIGHLKAWQAVRERQVVAAVNPPDLKAVEIQEAPAPTAPPSPAKRRAGKKRDPWAYIGEILPLKKQDPNITLKAAAVRIGVSPSTLTRLYGSHAEFRTMWDGLGQRGDRLDGRAKRSPQKSRRVAGERARRELEEGGD